MRKKINGNKEEENTKKTPKLQKPEAKNKETKRKLKLIGK